MALWVTVLSSCANYQIPNIQLCKEIPFVDAPEGACIETVSHKETLVSAKDWASQRPYQLVLSPDAWKAIKTNWLQTCRKAGADCNTKVDSIQGIIDTLDKIASVVLAP